MTFPWDVPVALRDDGIPAFLRRDANNRAPFMDVVATKPQPQPQACTEPPLMPWSADFNKPTE